MVAHRVPQRPARFGRSEKRRDGENMKWQSMGKCAGPFPSGQLWTDQAPEAGVRPPRPRPQWPQPLRRPGWPEGLQQRQTIHFQSVSNASPVFCF